jgi:hypothetical protein
MNSAGPFKARTNEFHEKSVAAGREKKSIFAEFDLIFLMTYSNKIAVF